MELIHKIMLAIYKPITWFKKVEGCEKLQQPCIVIAPHRKKLDGFIYYVCVYHQTGKRIRWLTWGDYYKNPIWRFHFWFTKQIKVEPEFPLNCLVEAEEVLWLNGIIGVFPEGKVTKKRLKHKKGYKILKANTGCKVVRLKLQ